MPRRGVWVEVPGLGNVHLELDVPPGRTITDEMIQRAMPWEWRQRFVQRLIDNAVKAGTHATGNPLRVCAGCGEFRPIFMTHTQYGRICYCKACSIASGLFVPPKAPATL